MRIGPASEDDDTGCESVHKASVTAVMGLWLLTYQEFF